MFERLKQDQIENRMKILRSQIYTPKLGWINTIRKAYQMSAQELANLVGVSQMNISKAEKSEANKKISLQTLEKIANSLNCDLQYALVPRVPISTYLESMAQKKAHILANQVFQTMQLEDQKINQEEWDRIYNNAFKDLIENPKKIWKSR